MNQREDSSTSNRLIFTLNTETLSQWKASGTHFILNKKQTHAWSTPIGINWMAHWQKRHFTDLFCLFFGVFFSMIGESHTKTFKIWGFPQTSTRSAKLAPDCPAFQLARFLQDILENLEVKKANGFTPPRKSDIFPLLLITVMHLSYLYSLLDIYQQDSANVLDQLTDRAASRKKGTGTMMETKIASISSLNVAGLDWKVQHIAIIYSLLS